MRQLTIAVFVKFGECCPQLSNLRLRNPRGDIRQSGLPQFGMLHIVLHILDHHGIQLYQIVFLIPLILDPCVVECFLSCQSNICCSLKESANQIFRIVADLSPHIALHLVLAVQNIVNDILIRLTSEWWFTAQHDEHDDTHGPHVTLGGVTTFQHFWRNVVRCSIWLVHDLIGVHSLGQPEINELDVRVIVLLIQQKVLRLDIPVANPVLVQITHCIKGLLHDATCLRLSQMLLLGNVVKELTSLAQFCD